MSISQSSVASMTSKRIHAEQFSGKFEQGAICFIVITLDPICNRSSIGREKSICTKNQNEHILRFRHKTRGKFSTGIKIHNDYQNVIE